MGIEILYRSDKNGGDERALGSDGRLNVSSRTDSRGYYNSRDEGQSYSLPFDFQSASAGEFAVYWKNTSTTKAIVIRSIGVNAVQNARIKLHYVTGTAAAGGLIAPTNLNKSSPNFASSITMEGASAGTGITGLTSDGVIDFVYVNANGHEEFRLDDQLRLGQNDAIAIEYEEGTDGDFSGVIFGYYE